MTVDYSQPEGTTGNQLIFYRFTTPSPGVWRVRVYSANKLNGVFHLYLAEESLQCGDVYFLTSNPDYTIVAPANARRVITVAGYNQRQNAILLESGRGYTLDGTIKPEFAAPAFQIDGAVAGGGDRPEPLQYEGRTGTSAASAVAAGASAMYMQWANQRGDIYVNTTQIKNALVRGASRLPDELYPNRQWGDNRNIVSREATDDADLFHRTSRLWNKIGRKNKKGQCMFGLTDEELDAMAAVDVRTVDIDTLTDLRDIEIDTSLPVEKKLASFAQQTNNVYLHRIGDYVVKVRFAEEGPSIDERMEEYLNCERSASDGKSIQTKDCAAHIAGAALDCKPSC